MLGGAAPAAVPLPSCHEIFTGRSLSRVNKNALDRLAQYLSQTGAASRKHRFRSAGNLGPEHLVIAVSPRTYPLYRQLFAETFPNLIEQVVAPDLFAGNYPEPPDVFHFWFRWGTHVYDYILPDGLRASEARMPGYGLSPVFLMSDSETRRFHDYMTLTAEPHTLLRYPHEIPGFNYPRDAYTTVGNCTGCFFHAPIGDATQSEVVVAGSLDGHGDGQGSEPRRGRLTDYVVPAEFADRADLVKRIWNPNLNLRLMDLIGMPPEKALHSGGGWVAHSLLTLAAKERVPFVVYYTHDEKVLPEPFLAPHWIFEAEPGCYAQDVAVGAEGDVWHIGYALQDGGFGLYQKKTGEPWQKINGSAARISVGPGRLAWVINDKNEIFRGVDGHWEHIGGAAVDVGVSAHGDVWVLGSNAVGGGFGLFHWNGEGWDNVDGGAVRLAVAPDGTPWVVNNSGQVFHRTEGQWHYVVSEAAHDIAVSPEGVVWIVAGDAKPGGFAAQYLKDGAWINTHAAGVDITVGPDGAPWIRERGGKMKRGREVEYD